MKTEKQIQHAITALTEDINVATMLGYRMYAQVLIGQRRALQSVLGENVGNWFWCDTCQIQHEGEDCPQCGSNNVYDWRKAAGIR